MPDLTSSGDTQRYIANNYDGLLTVALRHFRPRRLSFYLEEDRTVQGTARELFQASRDVVSRIVIQVLLWTILLPINVHDYGFIDPGIWSLKKDIPVQRIADRSFNRRDFTSSGIDSTKKWPGVHRVSSETHRQRREQNKISPSFDTTAEPVSNYVPVALQF